jgi:hypothetical protein
MSDSPTFQSRRERRAAESSAAAQQPLEQTPVAQAFESYIPSFSEPVTENTGYKPIVQETPAPLPQGPSYEPYVAPPSEPQVARSRRELRGLNDLKDSASTDRSPLFDDHTLTGSVPVVATPDIFLEPVTGSNFGSTANLGIEPVTASIILDKAPDMLGGSIVLSGSGPTVTTGSIQIPTVDPTTGSITVILESEKADEAIAEDSLNSFVSSVAPIRAAGIAKTRAKVVELTLINRKGQGQVYAVMSTVVLMISVGALTVAAFMLGIL